MNGLLSVGAMLGLCLSINSFANQSASRSIEIIDQWQSDDSEDIVRNHSLDSIDDRVTHYCWVTGDNGKGAIGNLMVGTWLDVPKAKEKAIERCQRFRDEAYCRANVVCRENDRPS